MRKQLPNGISYSEQYLDEETLEWLLRLHAEKVSPAEAPTPPAPTDTDAEKAFTAAWAEVAKDLDLAKAAQVRGYTYDKGLAEFKTSLSDPVTTGLAARVADAADRGYRVAVEGAAYVHYLQGDPVLSIPLTLASAKRLSDDFAFGMYIVLTVLDVILIIAACAGICVYWPHEQGWVSRLMGFMKRLTTWIRQPTVYETLEQLLRNTDRVGVVILFIKGIRDTVNVPALLGELVKEMSIWDKVIVLVQVLAAVLLAIATLGASLAAKIVGLVGALALTFIDAKGVYDNLPRPSTVTVS